MSAGKIAVAGVKLKAGLGGDVLRERLRAAPIDLRAQPFAVLPDKIDILLVRARGEVRQVEDLPRAGQDGRGRPDAVHAESGPDPARGLPADVEIAALGDDRRVVEVLLERQVEGRAEPAARPENVADDPLRVEFGSVDDVGDIGGVDRHRGLLFLVRRAGGPDRARPGGSRGRGATGDDQTVGPADDGHEGAADDVRADRDVGKLGADAGSADLPDALPVAADPGPGMAGPRRDLPPAGEDITIGGDRDPDLVDRGGVAADLEGRAPRPPGQDPQDDGVIVEVDDIDVPRGVDIDVDQVSLKVVDLAGIAEVDGRAPLPGDDIESRIKSVAGSEEDARQGVDLGPDGMDVPGGIDLDPRAGRLPAWGIRDVDDVLGRA